MTAVGRDPAGANTPLPQPRTGCAYSRYRHFPISQTPERCKAQVQHCGGAMGMHRPLKALPVALPPALGLLLQTLRPPHLSGCQAGGLCGALHDRTEGMRSEA